MERCSRVLLVSHATHQVLCFAGDVNVLDIILSIERPQQRCGVRNLAGMATKVDSSDRSLEADAWALLALKSPTPPVPRTPRVAPSTEWDSPQDAVPLARLEGRDFDYIMRKSRVTIGRNSRLGDVDVNMGNSSFVSRRHVEILYSNGRFHLRCFGRNGVFVNGVLHRDKTGALELPKT